MSKTVFTGAATAIITPFNADGVDYDAFGRLIDFQIEKGINAIVAAGTTGEGSTLTDSEHEEVIAFCVRRVAGRVPVFFSVRYVVLVLELSQPPPGSP